MKRSSEALKHELDYILEHTQRFYCESATIEEVTSLVAEMIAERKRDYLFQRLRDWQSEDLIALVAFFQESLSQPAVVEQPSQDGVEVYEETTKKRRKKSAAV